MEITILVNDALLKTVLAALHDRQFVLLSGIIQHRNNPTIVALNTRDLTQVDEAIQVFERALATTQSN